MTREQVLAMSAQEFAEATAVHVMGWKLVQHPADGFDVWATRFNELGQILEYREHHEWNPAESISAAWEVDRIVTDMRGITYLYRLAEVVSSLEIDGVDALDEFVTSSSFNLHAMVSANAEQRCKASLLAVMGI